MPTRAIEVAERHVDTDIEAALLAELRQRAPQGRNEAVTLSISAADGTLVAGLSGSTSYGWLLIKVLWVAPKMRRQGYGCALVADAFRRAKALGCHGAWLDTSDGDAKRFYTAMGFEVFGTLQNRGAQVPLGHQRWFLRCPIP
jgi:predicted N-acetyltransferase YhbS